MFHALRQFLALSLPLSCRFWTRWLARQTRRPLAKFLTYSERSFSMQVLCPSLGSAGFLYLFVFENWVLWFEGDNDWSPQVMVNTLTRNSCIPFCSAHSLQPCRGFAFHPLFGQVVLGNSLFSQRSFCHIDAVFLQSKDTSRSVGGETFKRACVDSTLPG